MRSTLGDVTKKLSGGEVKEDVSRNSRKKRQSQRRNTIIVESKFEWRVAMCLIEKAEVEFDNDDE